MPKAIISLIISLTLILFSGCQSKSPDTMPEDNTEKSQASELMSLYLTARENLNPLYADTENDINVFSLIYDSLIYLDSNMNIVPSLAESCVVSPDCKSIDFTLRQDIFWHDGEKFTADDVKYTFDKIKDSKAQSPYFDNLIAVTSVEIKDDYHFRLNLSGAYARIVNLLDFPIIPAHADSIDKTPVGTGQYKYKSGDNQKLVLTKNTLWKMGDLPAQENIEVKLLGKSTDQFTLFKTGELDLISVNLQQMSDFGITNKLNFSSFVTPKYEFIGYNFSNRVLADEAVRKAISYAINREEIINEAYLGLGTAVNAPILPTAYYYNSDVDKPVQSLEESRKILEEANWSDYDGDGILDKEIDGILFSLKAGLLVNSDNPMRIAAAKKICQMLSLCGMSITLDTVTWETYTERLSSDNFALFLGGIEFLPSFDHSHFLSSWAIENSQNFMNYSSKEMDKAISKTLSAVSMDECKSAYLDFQNIFSRENPVTGISFNHNCVIYQDNIEGVKEGCFSKPLINFNTWHRK